MRLERLQTERETKIKNRTEAQKLMVTYCNTSQKPLILYLWHGYNRNTLQLLGTYFSTPVCSDRCVYIQFFVSVSGSQGSGDACG